MIVFFLLWIACVRRTASWQPGISAMEKCDLIIETPTKDDFKLRELAGISWKSNFPRDLKEWMI